MNNHMGRGIVHGHVIELEGDAGIANGEQVEVTVRRLGPRGGRPGDGLLRTEGTLSEDSEWDTIMEEIQQSRKQERRPQGEDACRSCWIPTSARRTCGVPPGSPTVSSSTAASWRFPPLFWGELYAGAYHHSNPPWLLALIRDLLQDVHGLDFDIACAEQFGQVRGKRLQQGISVNTVDLMIASVALFGNLTLVTNNTADFHNIPGLRLEDWLTP